VSQRFGLKLPLKWVRLASRPEFLKAHEPERATASEARKSGLRYQAKAEAWVKGYFDQSEVHIGQWLQYEDASGMHWCQPDAWVVWKNPLRPEKSAVVVFEFKARHTPEAWYQLKLYGPLLGELYGLPVVLVEMTKSYDPFEVWPEKGFKLALDVAEFMGVLTSVGVPEAMVVFQWRHRRGD